MLNARWCVKRQMTCQMPGDKNEMLGSPSSSSFNSRWRAKRRLNISHFSFNIFQDKKCDFVAITFWVSYQIRPRCKWSISSFSLFKTFKIWSPLHKCTVATTVKFFGEQMEGLTTYSTNSSPMSWQQHCAKLKTKEWRNRWRREIQEHFWEMKTIILLVNIICIAVLFRIIYGIKGSNFPYR